MRNAGAVLALLALIFTGPGSAGALTVIDCFGDSITQGVPYVDYFPDGARVGGYEPPLEELYTAAGDEAHAHNHGWAGERTTEGLARIGGVLGSFTDLQYVLLMEGTNDLVDGTSPESIVFNLGVMVDRVKSAGAVPIIGTITPDTRPHRSKRIDETNSLIRQMADSKGVSSCELNGAMAANWSNLSDDLLHPNLAGYAVMAKVWYSCLAPLPPPPKPPSAGGGGDIGPLLDLLLR